jgi:hypothetical protein
MSNQGANSIESSEEVDAESRNIRAQRKQIEEASEDESLAAWEWDRMLFCLDEQCDRFNAAPLVKALEPAPAIRLEHMRPLWSRLTYLRGRDRHVMHVCYSVPLQCCTFEMHGQHVVYKQYVIVRDGKAHFQVYQPSEKDRDKTETREDVASRILRVFLAEAQWDMVDDGFLKGVAGMPASARRSRSLMSGT